MSAARLAALSRFGRRLAGLFGRRPERLAADRLRHPQRKVSYALGLLHFNPHWGANERSGHRHCAETFGPLLRILDRNPWWRVDVEISGSGLEFLRANYPDQLRLLRRLVERGQVELISALYTPSLWIGFPRRDLQKSIELNRRCLKALALPWTRIFFAQEAFFGAGVETLTDDFDIAVCKDDYLSYFYRDDLRHPHFRAGAMRVVVASGHILKDVSACHRSDPAFMERHQLSPSHDGYITRAVKLNDESNFPACRIQGPEAGCYWYHCGDGNHFGATAKPDNHERAYHDPAWSRAVTSVVERLRGEGHVFGTIGEFAQATATVEARPLPPLVEGAWNAGAADGVFCWMGRNSTPEEDDAGVLTAVSRARRRLLRAEAACPQLDRDAACRDAIDRAWRALLHSQISDTLGWSANSQAVAYALKAADHALTLSTRVIERHDGELEPPAKAVAVPAGGAASWPAIELFGAAGSGGYSVVAENVVVFDAMFRATEAECGLRMPFASDGELVFCPSGREHEPLRVPLEILKPQGVTLPLANGLLRVGEDLYAIKDTAFVHVAARIDRRARTLEFAVHGAPPGRPYHWRIFVVSTDLDGAVRLANQINHC